MYRYNLSWLTVVELSMSTVEAFIKIWFKMNRELNEGK